MSAKHAVDFRGIVVTRMFGKPSEHIRVDVNNATQRMTPILGRCLGNVPQLDFILPQFSEPRELIAFSGSQIHPGSRHCEQAKPTKQSRGKRFILCNTGSGLPRSARNDGVSLTPTAAHRRTARQSPPPPP